MTSPVGGRSRRAPLLGHFPALDGLRGLATASLVAAQLSWTLVEGRALRFGRRFRPAEHQPLSPVLGEGVAVTADRQSHPAAQAA